MNILSQGGKCARTLVDCILVKVEIADTSEKSLTEEEERSKGMQPRSIDIIRSDINISVYDS